MRFVVLDGNDSGSPAHKGGYPSYIGPEQTAWLKATLEDADKPLVLVNHQPLAGPYAVDNAEEIQEILGAASDKILLAINGHTHIDMHLRVKNIDFIHINSASYYWMGEAYKHTSYSEEIHKTHPWISYTCPYKEALFTSLTIDPEKGSIHIQGRSTQWVGPAPKDLDYSDPSGVEPGKEVVPEIRDRNISKRVSPAV